MTLQSNDSLVKEIIFIDPTVEDYESLIAGIYPDTKVVIIDRMKDGISQITENLQGGKYKAVHIVSHGSEGSLQLGSKQLNSSNLDTYKSQLQLWANYLTDDADILLYGCDVAAGQTGVSFVQQLSQLTGADVAASNDLTGNAALGGNWDLEVKTGKIEAPLAFQVGVMEAYNAVLSNIYYDLAASNFSQDWSNKALITTNDNWNNVPSIVGYRGDNLASTTGVDPQTVLADGSSTPIDVNVNRNDPNAFTTGGVTEFDGISNPVVALQGSGTARAPHLVLYLDTTDKQNINVSFTLRDIDGSANNAIQQIALQYRIGNTGNFINLPDGFVNDATSGPNLAVQQNSVSVVLPAAANNQPQLQVRIITTDATGSDEWVGIDDIKVISTNATLPNQAPVILNNPSNLTLIAINEDISDSANVGTKVSDLINGLITDADGDPKAIAVTGVNNTNGKWQLSTNAGTTWTDFDTVSDNSAVVLGAIPLYTAGLGTTPASQNWLSLTNISGAIETTSTNGTKLNTTAINSIYAGYSNYTATLVNSNFPTLNRTSGYSLSFNMRLLAESRTNSDRAGFSVIAISSDGTRGIELGFQQSSATSGNIFAQGDGITANPGGQTNSLFKAAENVSFNTNLATNYTLSVQGDSYHLFANGIDILTGPLRDYTKFTGTINPYKTQNFIFLGDDTTSASGTFNLKQVVLQTDTRVRFVPNANYNGTSDITFRAWDTTNGTANGTTGVNASNNGGTSSFSNTSAKATITVNSVNDRPSFTIGNNQSVKTGVTQTIALWASGFNSGATNETQTVAGYIVKVVNDVNADIFEATPTINKAGDLIYTAKTGITASKTATIQVQVQDNGGTDNGGVNTSDAQTFTITVNPTATNSLNGTPNPDNLIGTDQSDRISGLDNDDTIYGGLGSDRIFGNNGNDILYGDLGIIFNSDPKQISDVQPPVYGATFSRDDTIAGGAGNDKIYGNLGNDKLYGDEGDDLIWGGEGNDEIWGSYGNDTLYGGTGKDTFVLVRGQGADTIMDFTTEDVLGCAGALRYSSLSFKTQNGDTLITDTGTNQLLATLKGFTGTASDGGLF